VRKKITKPSHVSTVDSLWKDLGLTPDEAAVMELKLSLHREIMKEVEKQKLTPKKVGQALGIQQPQVSDLLCGKVSKKSVDLLTKYLCRLGRKVQITTKKSPKIQDTAVA